MLTATACTPMLRAADTPILSHYLLGALRSTPFDSRRTVTSHHARQIADEIVDSFQRYLSDCEGADAVRAFGRCLAHDGIDHTSILAIAEALHGFSWELCETQPAAEWRAVHYCSCLLTGYMAAREEYLLCEQERIRLTLDWARMRAEAKATLRNVAAEPCYGD
jgi:hypothetical protein